MSRSRGFYHSLFWRTRLIESDGGFLTTIQNMMAVAADKAYLIDLASVFFGLANFVWRIAWLQMIPLGIAYQVKIYCVWLFLRFTSAGRPIGIPTASLSYAFRRSGTANFVSYLNCEPPYEPYPWFLLSRLDRFQ